jgi:trimethylamine--corrinoid protein Co-methyltransferase
LEAGVTLALAAAAGADIFGHMGISGVDQATSLDMLVLQNEIVSYVERALRPVDTSADALATELVDEVVRNGGGFLDAEHTVRRFRQELWVPRLLDRQYYQGWLDAGGRSTADRCRERRDEMLARPQPAPMDPGLAKAVDEIVAASRRLAAAPTGLVAR